MCLFLNLLLFNIFSVDDEDFVACGEDCLNRLLMIEWYDQKQFSPNNIHTLSRDKVTRINKMITKGKMR